MRARSTLTAAGGWLLIAAVAGAQAPLASDAPGQVEEPTTQRAQPAPQQIVDESPFSTRSILKRSAAVVQGTVERIRYAYDEHTGPRTVVTLSVAKVLAGRYVEPKVELRLFGGPTDDGRFYSTSESIELVEHASYVLFLRNDAWFFEPTAGTTLRVEDVGGLQVLADTMGRPLRGLSPRGMTFVPEPAPHNAGAEAWAGALELSVFGTLLDEAMVEERVAPSGRFTPDPLRRENWRDTPAAPPASEALPEMEGK